MWGAVKCSFASNLEMLALNRAHQRDLLYINTVELCMDTRTRSYNEKPLVMGGHS